MTASDRKSILKTTLLLFLICAVVTGIVAFVNLLTEDVIAGNEAAAADRAKFTVLPTAASFSPAELSDGKVGYIGKNDSGETVGYVFTTSANGYGGKLTVMTGFDRSGAVTGLVFLTLNETPGLGMNAKKDSFVTQFIGTDGELSVVKGREADENEIMAITSASITSNAVVKAVNLAREYFREITSGEEAAS